MSEQTKSGISRRTLAKGAAWSVPAAAVVAAAPAYAKSGGAPKIVGGQAFKLSGNSCKQAGAQGNRWAYLFTFQVTNNTGETIYLYGATITVTPDLDFRVTEADPAWGTAIAPGATVGIGVWGNGTDSGNTALSASAQVFWGHVKPPSTLTLPIPSNATNPDKLPNGQPWHAPVSVGPWTMCATPTLPSQGLEKCKSPGYQPVDPTCPQPPAPSEQTAREAVADEAMTKAPELRVEANPEPTKAPEAKPESAKAPEAEPEPTPSAAAEASTDADA